MFIFVLQLREALQGRWSVLLFFAFFAALVWLMWGVKTLISRRYRPWTEPYDAPASVIVPVVDEPIVLFNEVLARITAQRPHEVIVVINGPENLPLQQACTDAGVHWVWTRTPGKRNAIRIGVEHATGEIAVLVDSDTIWTHNTLPELLKPFIEPLIGGATTKQRIMLPRRCFYTRWADWMENSRARYSLPAQSVLGQVGCLPGRTIAFRMTILQKVMDDFMTEEFLGVFLEVSDDRTLTNLTLKAGYRTAFQETSLVYTDAPTDIRKLARQQLRWARGSQYNHLRMLPWMVSHAPFLTLFCAVDVLLPFLLAGSAFAWGWHAITQTGVNFMTPILDAVPGLGGHALVAAFIVGGAALSMWLRQHRHLVDVPADYLWMPTYVLFSSFFLMPLRLYGFVRMAHAAGWGTRSQAYSGGERRRLNALAAVPYLLAAVLIGAEVALVVTLS